MSKPQGDAYISEEDFDELDPRHYIIIKRARVNNLKNLSLAIPRNKLVVVTGVSGSGKSSLAFETLYAEGQRIKPFQLCQAVPWKNGKTRRGLYKRGGAGHSH